MQRLIDVGIELAVPPTAIQRIEATVYLNERPVFWGCLHSGALPTKAPMTKVMRTLFRNYQRECPKRGRAIKRLGRFNREPYRFYHLGRRSKGVPMWEPLAELSMDVYAHLRTPMAPDHPPLLYFRAAQRTLHRSGPHFRYGADRYWSFLTPLRLRSVEVNVSPSGLVVEIHARA